MKRKIGEPFGRSDSNSALFQIAEIIRKAGMADHPGDSILAHISPEEARILKKRGGAGKPNKRTGALSFYEEGNDDNDSYGGRDEGDRGRSAAESGGAGGFGSGSSGGSGGDPSGNNGGGFNYGESFGPSYADLGIEAQGYGPSISEFGGTSPSAPEALSGRDAYGPTAGPGGMPANGNVYAGYNPDPPSFGEKYGGSIMGVAGGLLGGPVGGLVGRALGQEIFSRPEQGSLIGSAYDDGSAMTADQSDTSMGIRGIDTQQSSAYFNDRDAGGNSVGAQQITQAMPQTVIQPAVSLAAVSPWRTYQPPQVDWAHYGEGSGQSFYDRVNPLTNKFANGGAIQRPSPQMPSGGALMGLVDGPGDGESDSIPVRMPSGEGGALSAGEYVIPAADVAAIGNGSSMAGARAIDGALMNVRRSHIDHLSQKPPPRR